MSERDEHEHQVQPHAGAKSRPPAEHGELHRHAREHRRAGEDRDVCRRCGANEHVHRGLCRRCRRVLMGEGSVVTEEKVPEPHQAQPEPLHRPPWKRRGA